MFVCINSPIGQDSCRFLVLAHMILHLTLHQKEAYNVSNILTQFGLSELSFNDPVNNTSVMSKFPERWKNKQEGHMALDRSS